MPVVKPIMGENLVKSMGSRGRKDLLQYLPEDVVLVKDPKHPLYDPRVHNTFEERAVRNYMRRGVLEPIAVRKNGLRPDGSTIIEVVWGRQRVINGLEANRRLLAEGRDLLYISAIVKSARDEADLLGMSMSENAIRRSVSPLQLAEQIRRYVEDYHRSEEDAAEEIGGSVQKVKMYRALLDCEASVQEAVETHVIALTLAVKMFAHMPREEQKEALEKFLASGGATKGAAAEENLRAVVRGEKPVNTAARRPGRKKLSRIVTTLAPYQDDPILKYIAIGVRISLGEKPPELAEIMKLVKAAEKAGKPAPVHPKQVSFIDDAAPAATAVE